MKTTRKMLLALALFLLGAFRLIGGGSVVPVGTYLYADLEKLEPASGVLVLRFASPGPDRLVVAFGRKHRKDRKTRDGSPRAGFSMTIFVTSGNWFKALCLPAPQQRPAPYCFAG